MTHYTSERGYGLDLSGPEPVWRGKKPGWNRISAISKWRRRYGFQVPPDRTMLLRWGAKIYIPRARIDDYIKKGLIDPARRDDL